MNHEITILREAVQTLAIQVTLLTRQIEGYTKSPSMSVVREPFTGSRPSTRHFETAARHYETAAPSLGCHPEGVLSPKDLFFARLFRAAGVRR